MKVFLRLCHSIVRRNKGFTAGIFLMSVLSVAIAFLGANFGASSDETIMNFLTKSNTPDAVLSTELMQESDAVRITEVKGVRRVSSRLVTDTNMETADGKLFSVRIFCMASDPGVVQTVHEERKVTSGDPRVSISLDFAEHNGIHAGDTILIETPGGRKRACIGAVVSNPETMNCVKDEMSAYESNRFGYLYLEKDEAEKLFSAGGMINQCLLYFDRDLSAGEQKECVKAIRRLPEIPVISETFTEESDAMKSIRDDLRTISILCAFIPGIIWLISLGFHFIFIKIIAENQRKTVGLLRALGFSVRKVVLLFVTYTVLVNLPAICLGFFLGSRILSLCLGLIADAEGIIETKVVILPAATVPVAVMGVAIGIIAALCSAGSIAKIDPSEAYGGAAGSSKEPPEFLQDLNTNVFMKISTVSIARNLRRQIIGAFCIAACVVCMCVGFEGVLSIGYPIDAVFGDRYRYDLMVRDLDREAVSAITENVAGIKTAEPATFFMADLSGEPVRVSVLYGEEELTVLTDASGKRLLPEEGIIIDEMRAKLHGISAGDALKLDDLVLPVTGIAREILFPVMYVSPETAARMGQAESNGLLLKLEEGTSIDDVEADIAKICRTAYFAEFSAQKECITGAFRTMRTIMFVFAVIAFAIGSLLVFNISIIDFNENRTRFATLRALGASPGRLAVVSLMQNLFRVALGILIACPLCYVCVTVLLELLSGASQQYVMVGYGKCLLAACLIPLLYVLLGAGVSLHKIRKLDFYSYLSEVE